MPQENEEQHLHIQNFPKDENGYVRIAFRWEHTPEEEGPDFEMSFADQRGIDEVLKILFSARFELRNKSEESSQLELEGLSP